MSLIKNFLREEDGVTAIEYGLIAALIGVAILAAVGLIGTNLNAVAAPVIINGRLGAAKDVDRFAFKAGSDGKLVCEVEGRRFGSPLDALLAVYAGESLVAQNDDAAGTDAPQAKPFLMDRTLFGYLREAMMPAPMPVETFTKIRSSTCGHIVACSPRARMFTSLSTSTGTSNVRCT